MAGASKSHADRLQDGRGRVRVEVYLSPEAGRALDRLAVVLGSKTAVLDAAILAFDADTEPR